MFYNFFKLIFVKCKNYFYKKQLDYNEIIDFLDIDTSEEIVELNDEYIKYILIN